MVRGMLVPTTPVRRWRGCVPDMATIAMCGPCGTNACNGRSGRDPTDDWWRMGRMRLYCLVAGYYLGFVDYSEYERYLEKTPFRRCGSDGVLLSRAFQQLEFAMPVAPDTPGCSGL